MQGRAVAIGNEMRKRGEMAPVIQKNNSVTITVERKKIITNTVEGWKGS